MPADFESIPGTRTVHSRGWGALTDADLLGHMARIAALFKSGVLDSDWAQIADFSGVEHMDGLSAAGIRRAAEENPWPRYAVLACSSWPPTSSCAWLRTYPGPGQSRRPTMSASPARSPTPRTSSPASAPAWASPSERARRRHGARRFTFNSLSKR